MLFDLRRHACPVLALHSESNGRHIRVMFCHIWKIIWLRIFVGGSFGCVLLLKIVEWLGNGCFSRLALGAGWR